MKIGYKADFQFLFYFFIIYRNCSLNVSVKIDKVDYKKDNQYCDYSYGKVFHVYLLQNENIQNKHIDYTIFFACFKFPVRIKKKPHSDFLLCILIVFTLSGSFRFFLTLYARLLVMFSLTNFLLNTGLSTVSLKTS